MTDVGRAVETLAIVMTDVEGSTALRLERGDAVADEMLRAHAEILRAEVARHGGCERQFLGDGFLLSFGTPREAVNRWAPRCGEWLVQSALHCGSLWR